MSPAWSWLLVIGVAVGGAIVGALIVAGLDRLLDELRKRRTMRAYHRQLQRLPSTFERDRHAA